MKCLDCGKKQTLIRGFFDICDECSAKKQKVDKELEEERQEVRKKKQEVRKRLQEAAERVILTTTNTVDGYYVKKYMGIESVEYVIGTGLFSEVVTEVQDVFGARSSPFEKKLQKAKQEAFEVLKLLAAQKDANAVVGIDLDYTEFSGNRVALILNGTLVQLAPRRSRDSSRT